MPFNSARMDLSSILTTSSILLSEWLILLLSIGLVVSGLVIFIDFACSAVTIESVPLLLFKASSLLFPTGGSTLKSQDVLDPSGCFDWLSFLGGLSPAFPTSLNRLKVRSLLPLLSPPCKYRTIESCILSPNVLCHHT